MYYTYHIIHNDIINYRQRDSDEWKLWTTSSLYIFIVGEKDILVDNGFPEKEYNLHAVMPQ